MQTNDRYMPVSLNHAQRRAIADLFPQMKHRLRLDAQGRPRIDFQVGELQAILWCAGDAAVASRSGTGRNTLRQIIEACQQAIRVAHGIGAIQSSQRLYQFKITLQGIEPPVWRRIQVRDCTVDKLHEHIQTVMGWTNSHLHRFEIEGIVHGDPELLVGDPEPECFVGINSLKTRISDLIPQSGARFRFAYEYDFGDRWEHEVLFEGCLQHDQGRRYPLCLEGERACPPEDVGGIQGYQDFLTALADPSHEDHLEWKQWAGGNFDPERFDALSATRRMRRGLPNWRRVDVRS